MSDRRTSLASFHGCLGSSRSVIVICRSGAHIEYADGESVEGGLSITEWYGSEFCLESVFF